MRLPRLGGGPHQRRRRGRRGEQFESCATADRLHAFPIICNLQSAICNLQFHSVPLPRDCAMNSEVRIDSARIVHVQFLCAFETNGPASATNRFLTSCAWQFAFSTDDFGSFPILVVPTSWMIRPTGSIP